MEDVSRSENVFGILSVPAHELRPGMNRGARWCVSKQQGGCQAYGTWGLPVPEGLSQATRNDAGHKRETPSR